MTTPRLRLDKRRTDPIPSGSILLETEPHVPARDERLVRRPKLLGLLDAGAGRRLMLVAAPTGFGKTTLLASLVCRPEGYHRPVAWISLDAGDNDPSRLWTNVAEALSRIHPTVGQLIGSPDNHPIGVMRHHRAAPKLASGIGTR